MDHSRNHNILSLSAVDNPVAVDEKFANILVIEFGDFPASKWKLTENSRLVYDRLKNNASVGRRIRGNVIRDRFEILSGAATRLLGEPFLEACFNFVLRERPVHPRIFQPAPHLVEYV
jgi:hypothetical protein